MLGHADDPRLRRMAVLDAVLNNADRKGGHVLPGPDGVVHGVDHGVCFHVEHKLRTVLWGWAGEPLHRRGRRGCSTALRPTARRPLGTAAARAARPRRGHGLPPPGRPAAARRAPAVARRGLAGHPLAAVLTRRPTFGDARPRRIPAVHAWPAPDVPTLPGTGLRAAAARHRRPARCGRPRPAATARMYVCGITPYDATHIGHAATYVAFDLRAPGLARRRARRALRAERHRRRRPAARARHARRRGLARRWPSARPTLFREDMTALRRPPPARVRRRGRVDPVGRRAASQPLRERGAALRRRRRRLLRRAHATRASAGSATRTTTTMLALFAERGGDPDRPGKKHPLDCLLWQAARPGEPSWESADSAAGPAGLAHRVRRDRAGAPRRRPSTCRAAAATWCSRTTR